jgi:PIN domain nuclease of toxin-antitoxin system
MLVLMDTHAWVWSANGDTRQVGRRARQLLAKAERADAIRVSPLSVFEITALHHAGRLRLSRSVEQWVQGALTAAGVRLAPFSSDMALDAGSIPRTALADPLDRLIVATARHLDATLVTSDARILSYASATRNVRVQEAHA